MQTPTSKPATKSLLGFALHHLRGWTETLLQASKPQASCCDAGAGPCVTPCLIAMQACSHDALDISISYLSKPHGHDCKTGHDAVVPKAVL